MTLENLDNLVKIKQLKSEPSDQVLPSAIHGLNKIGVRAQFFLTLEENVH